MKKLSTLIAALALGATAFAADEPKPAAPEAPAAPAAPAAEGEKKPHRTPEEIFKALDTNNDGVISLDEFKAGPRGKKDPAKAEEAYKKMNTTNDGKLTLEQFKAGHHEKKPQ